MPKVERAGDRIHIWSELREKDLVKQIPGTRYDRDLGLWHAPLSWGACQAMRSIFKDRLEVGPLLAEWAWDEHKNRIEPTTQLRDLLSLRLPDLPARDGGDGAQLFPWENLFDYQGVVAAFGSISERFLNGSDTGTGKTISTLATIARWEMRNGDALPVLIICPNSMKGVWKREIEKWTPWLKPVVIRGSAAKRKKQIEEVARGEASVAIINWEALRSHSKVAGYGSIHLKACKSCGGDETVKETACEVHLKELNRILWRTIVADEAHRMKSPKAIQTRAAWALAEKSGARYRLALTGTPIADAPDDLWSVMHFVAPEDWGNKTGFVSRFCALAFNPFGGMDIAGLRVENKEEFYRIFDSRFIRHIREVVLPQIPKYLPAQVRLLEMAPAQAKAYKQMQEKMVAGTDGGVLIETSPLQQAMRLGQFACASATMGEDGMPILAAPSNKVDALLEIIDEQAGKPLVAMAESIQLIRLVEERLTKEKIPFVTIYGDTPEEDRDEIQQKFQTGTIPVFLGTLGAGSEGLTLTAADTFVYLQRSWSNLKNTQAEGRLPRPGNDAEHLRIIDLISEGTVEEARLEALAGKDSRMEEIVRDNHALAKMVTFGGEKVVKEKKSRAKGKKKEGGAVEASASDSADA